MLKYKLFDCLKKGFIFTREPILKSVQEDLIISFDCAPLGGTAIFENTKKQSIYRRLDKNGECTLPTAFIDGNIAVCVADLEDNTIKYQCENIYAKVIGEHIIVCPNGVDIPVQIIEFCGELQGVKGGIKELFGKFDSLDKKVEKLLDGYDFD